MRSRRIEARDVETELRDPENCSDSYEQRAKDFEWALGLNRLTLRFMGIWPEVAEAEAPLRRLWLELRAPFLIATILLWMFLPQMYALAMVMHELPLVIDNLMTSPSAFASSAKLFIIWRNQRTLRPIIRFATEDWLRPKLDWEREAMIREAARARVFTVMGNGFMFGSFIAYIVAPVAGLDVRTINNITDRGERHLLVQCYFPYDTVDSPYFELTYVCQCVAGLFIGMGLSATDNYFAALVFHVGAQFEVLGMHLENSVRRGSDDRGSGKIENGAGGQRLQIGTFVERHVELARIVTAIEYSFGFAVLTQIFCMSITVMSLGFEIILLLDAESEHETSFFQLVTLMCTLFTHASHTLLDCYAAEELAFRSNGIFHDVYKSKWYTVEQHRSQDVIPIMAASKNPRSLMAGKILTLSLSTYCSILKSTGGYISMLIAVHKR